MQKKTSLSQGIIILIALCLPTFAFSEEPEAISLLGKQLYRSARRSGRLRHPQAAGRADPGDGLATSTMDRFAGYALLIE